MLQTDLRKNDKLAHVLIWIFSAVVFSLIVYTERIHLDVNLPFNPHVFAALSALVNSGVAILLVWALLVVKKKNYELHRKIMIGAMVLSIFFLLFYVAHHLFSRSTYYGDVNHDGLVSPAEIADAGMARTIYRIMIATHIVLAGIIMPFVLYTAYRALIGEYSVHKKLARWTFPIWLYVAVTGVLVYLMISKYYV